MEARFRDGTRIAEALISWLNNNYKCGAAAEGVSSQPALVDPTVIQVWQCRHESPTGASELDFIRSSTSYSSVSVIFGPQNNEVNAPVF